MRSAKAIETESISPAAIGQRTRVCSNPKRALDDHRRKGGGLKPGDGDSMSRAVPLLRRSTVPLAEAGSGLNAPDVYADGQIALACPESSASHKRWCGGCAAFGIS